MAARTAVVAGTASAVSGRVARRQQKKYASQDAAYVEQQAAAAQQGYDEGAQAQAAPAPAPAPEAEDLTAQLEELAALKDKGILTEEEFQAKKKQILGI